MMFKVFLVIVICVLTESWIYPDDPKLYNSEPHEPPHKYPETKISEIIQKESFPLQGFFEDEGEEEEEDFVLSIDTKVAVAAEYKNICEEVTQYIYPRWGENKNGTGLFIVNGVEYRQKVRITKCLSSEEEPCSHAQFDSYCQQEYFDYKLVAFNEENEQLVVDTFPFPSCCICKVKRKSWL